MSRYEIENLPAAARDLKALDKLTQKLIDAAIQPLGDNPRPHGSKKLQGTNAYRIRVSTQHGPFRILYTINDDAKKVTIAGVVPRKDAY